MRRSEFSDHMWGKLVRADTGYWAFQPANLPPRVEPTWALMANNSRADRDLSQLAGLARNLPNPHLLIAPFVRREAVLSSKIEGTQASLSDLLLFEASEATAGSDIPSDVREVYNYVQALEFGLDRLKTLPLSLRLIREIHQRLMADVRGGAMTPGEFRRSQNWIGPPGCTLDTATFVPPPVPEMNAALSAFERFLHHPPELPPLVRLAQAHYQFEAIHPFLDGNGRVGRLLITLIMCLEKLLPQPLLYLSAFFEQNRDEYYARLLDVSRRGRWAEWIKFFLRGVAEQAADAMLRTGALLDHWRDLREKVRGASALPLRVVDRLFESPILSIAQVAKFLGVTRRAAAMNIDRLQRLGVIEEITGRRRFRLFAARRIIAIVESPAAPTLESTP